MATKTMPGLAKFPRRRDGYYHCYGEKYVSVTEVLNIKAKPLVPWAAKTAASLVLNDPVTYDTAEKAAAGIYQIRDKAADRGSTVHSLAEAVLLGNEPEPKDVPEHLRGRYAALLSFRRALQPKIIETEANVYSQKHHYAGTTDLICEIGGRVGLVDFKTGRDIYAEAAYQLAAYRAADFILTKDDPPLQIPMLKTEFGAVCLLSDDGTFQFKEMRAPVEVFLALLTVWRYEKEGRL